VIRYVVVNQHEVVEAQGNCSIEAEIPSVRAGQRMEILPEDSLGITLSVMGHTFDPATGTFTPPRDLNLQFDKSVVEIDEVATIEDVPAGTIRVVTTDFDQTEEHPGGDFEFSSNKPGKYTVIIRPIHDKAWSLKIEVLP
jgi:hypothetical protein